MSGLHQEPSLAMAALIDAIADPLILIAGHRVVAANEAARTLLPGEPVGRDVDALLPEPVARALDQRPGEPPVIVADFGGLRRHWEVRVRSIEPNHCLLHLIDRTAMEAVEKMRVDFVANASHELRTPIAAISGFAETLAEDEAGGDPPTRRHFAEIIVREARRMQRLVEDLMSLSRIEADRHVAPDEAVDLAAVAAAAAQAAAEQRQPRGADLVIEPSDRPVVVLGDRAQLTQLVHNLVSNGFKYGEVGTPVTLAVARAGTMGRLTVADCGEGIPASHLGRVTERFFRVDVRRSRAVGGTGLGLAIVKHIVERHGGVLTIVSEVGVGTNVSVDLPLAPGPSGSVGRRPEAIHERPAIRDHAGAVHE